MKSCKNKYLKIHIFPFLGTPFLDAKFIEGKEGDKVK
jgi:hypothetical protein